MEPAPATFPHGRRRGWAPLVLAAWLPVAACDGQAYPIGTRLLSDATTQEPETDCDSLPTETLLACSEFEDDTYPEWSGQILNGSAEFGPTLENEPVYAGSKALHAVSTGRDSTAVLEKTFAARRSGSLYLRAHLFLPSGITTETMNIFFLGFEANPVDDAPFQGLDINIEAGALQLYSPQNAPDRLTGSEQLPRDRWFCLQMEVGLQEPEGAVQLWVDGDLFLEAESLVTVPEAGVTRLRLGIDWSSAQDAFFEMYFDDVALATQPVSCR